MIDKEKIQEIAEEHLQGSDIFVVEVKVSSSNHIRVFLDGDQGVPISACAGLSRHLESFFDRDREDFELEVSSVGVDKPLQLPRQFIKNVGREIIFVNQEDQKVLAKLLAADQQGVRVELLPKGAKKKNTSKDQPTLINLPYDQIRDVKVQVSFKKPPQKSK